MFCTIELISSSHTAAWGAGAKRWARWAKPGGCAHTAAAPGSAPTQHLRPQLPPKHSAAPPPAHLELAQLLAAQHQRAGRGAEELQRPHVPAAVRVGGRQRAPIRSWLSGQLQARMHPTQACTPMLVSTSYRPQGARGTFVPAGRLGQEGRARRPTRRGGTAARRRLYRAVGSIASRPPRPHLVERTLGHGLPHQRNRFAHAHADQAGPPGQPRGLARARAGPSLRRSALGLELGLRRAAVHLGAQTHRALQAGPEQQAGGTRRWRSGGRAGGQHRLLPPLVSGLLLPLLLLLRPLSCCTHV